MGRLVVVVDPALEVAPADLVSAWNADAQARAAGRAVVEKAPRGDFFGVVELVVIPAAVGLGVNAITALTGRLVGKLRPQRAGEAELEVAEMTQASGDRVVVVRLREVPR
jgi:hypothetical protein